MVNRRFEKIIEKLEQLSLPLVMRGNYWHDYYIIDKEGGRTTALLVSRTGFQTLSIKKFIEFLEEKEELEKLEKLLGL